MPHSSTGDPPVIDDDVGSTNSSRPTTGKFGKASVYLNHRVIVQGPSVMKSADVAAAQRSFLSTFKPWQIAAITVLAIAAWAAPVGLLIIFFRH